MVSPSSKMGQELKFQQRWEFRRRDNDFDSSSDDSRSSSSGEPVFKKHKLVSTLISPENDETSNTPRFLQKGKDDAGTGGQFKSGKAKKKKIGSSKKDNLVSNDMERDSFRKVNRKRSKSSAYEPSSLNEIKIFMDSLLEELKVTRENLFIRMREEMHKLMADDTPPLPTRREGGYEHEAVQVQDRSNYGHEIAQVQRQNNFESGMKLTADDTTTQPTRREGSYGQEIAQVQHQNDFESGVNLTADDTARQPTRREGSYGQEIAQVQHQNNFESGVKLTTDDTTRQPTRREGSYGQEIVQLQHQNNFESGVKLTADDTTRQPTRREGSYGQEIAQVQHQNNFESGVKLAADDSTRQPTRREGSYGQEIFQLQHHNNFESGMKAQKCNHGSLERSVKGRRTADSNSRYQVFEGQVEHGQDIEPMTSTEKENGERFGLFVKPNFSTNSSDQVASSMYLTLPTVLPEPHVENHRINSSSCNYIQPGISGNKTGGNLERANLMLDVSTQRGYFSGMQQEEQLESIAQVGSRNMGCFDQNIAPTSSIGAGFPVPLHQGLDGDFSIPSQVGMETLPRENNNILGLRMNGGAIRFSDGSHALPENYVANNFHSHWNYKTDDRLVAFRTRDLKEGRLFLN